MWCATVRATFTAPRFAAVAFSKGTVFKLDTTGKETVLYSFTGGADGANRSAVIRDAAGNLYGTTAAGGDLTVTAVSAGHGVQAG